MVCLSLRDAGLATIMLLDDNSDPFLALSLLVFLSLAADFASLDWLCFFDAPGRDSTPRSGFNPTYNLRRFTTMTMAQEKDRDVVREGKRERRGRAGARDKEKEKDKHRVRDRVRERDRDKRKGRDHDHDDDDKHRRRRAREEKNLHHDKERENTAAAYTPEFLNTLAKSNSSTKAEFDVISGASPRTSCLRGPVPSTPSHAQPRSTSIIDPSIKDPAVGHNGNLKRTLQPVVFALPRSAGDARRRWWIFI
ncbi:hypothetical protein K438DRAFT_1989292 [Mycena galopus ATCC 62051]|nr:hypothetical protein K438DRAFT_1989292 [Mycena galopus ATCC 62051]